MGKVIIAGAIPALVTILILVVVSFTWGYYADNQFVVERTNEAVIGQVENSDSSLEDVAFLRVQYYYVIWKGISWGVLLIGSIISIICAVGAYKKYRR